MPHSQWQVRGARLLHRPSQLMPHQAQRLRGVMIPGFRASPPPLVTGTEQVLAPRWREGQVISTPPTLMWLCDPRRCQ